MKKAEYEDLKNKLIKATKINEFVFNELLKRDVNQLEKLTEYKRINFNNLCIHVEYLNRFYAIHKEIELPENVIKFKKKS